MMKKIINTLANVSTIIKNSKKEKRNFWWWLKTAGETVLTTAVAFAPELLELFPEHTMLFKLALPVGFILKQMKMKSENQKDVLPSGVGKYYDKMPNGITGIKGSRK